MRLALLTAVIGLAAGIVLARIVTARGTPGGRQPPRQRIRWLPVAVVGIVVAVASLWTDGQAFVTLRLVGTAALVAVGVVNHDRPGARLLTAGVVANGLVVIPNAGMPVALDAIVAAGTPGTLPTSGRRHLLTDTDVLPWLADTVGVAWLETVLSPGDVLVAAGFAVVIATVLAALVRRRQRETATTPSSTPGPPPGPIPDPKAPTTEPTPDPDPDTTTGPDAGQDVDARLWDDVAERGGS